MFDTTTTPITLSASQLTPASTDNMTFREIRLAAGRSQARAAVDAGVAEPTLRLFEASREAVSPRKRKALDAVYAAMRVEVETHGSRL